MKAGMHGWAKAWPLVLPLLLGLLLRLAPLLRASFSFALRADDSFEYLQLATGLRSGCGFARMIDGVCQKPEILRTPGYPLFLTMTPDIRAILVTQAIVGTLAAALIGIFLWNCGYRAAAVSAELFIVLDIPSIVMSAEAMSEALFQFFLVVAVAPVFLLSLRSRLPIATALVAGLAGGAALLIRPIAVLLPLLLPVLFLLNPLADRRKKLVSAGISFAIPLLILLAWSARNYEVAHYPGLSTVGAINLYYYRAADVVAREQGMLLADTRQSFGDALGVSYDHIYDANVQSPALADKMHRLAIPTLERHWPQVIEMTLQSAIYLAAAPIRSPLAGLLGTSGASSGDGLSAGAPTFGRLRAVLRRMLQSPLLTVAVLAESGLTIVLWIGIALALLRCRRGPVEYRIWTIYLLLSALLLLVLAAGGEADVRFRAPVAPLLAAVAALGYFPTELQHARQAASGDLRSPRLVA